MADNVANPKPSLMKYHRRKAGLTIPEAAEKIGCSIPSVYHWEAGEHVPKPCNLKAMADAYEVDESQFFVATQEIRDMYAAYLEEYIVNPKGNVDRKAAIAVQILSLPPEPIGEDVDLPDNPMTAMVNDDADTD